MIGKYVKAFDYKWRDKDVHAVGQVVEEIKKNGEVVGYIIQNTSKKRAIVRKSDISKVANSYYELIVGGDTDDTSIRSER